jgi:chloramphenicol-sensitive protein RarD
MTAIPLLLFVASARRLRLATVGFLQYLAPTGQFLLAVLAFGEPFDSRMGIAFAAIWAALALYSADAVVAQRKERQPRVRV